HRAPPPAGLLRRPGRGRLHAGAAAPRAGRRPLSPAAKGATWTAPSPPKRLRTGPLVSSPACSPAKAPRSTSASPSPRRRTCSRPGAGLEEFTASRYAADAVRVRRWDDQAKDPHAGAPEFSHFRALLGGLLR